MKDEIISIRDLDNDLYYKALRGGIHLVYLQEEFLKMCKLTTTKYAHLFEKEAFTTKRYPSENIPEGYSCIQYILPTLKRVFSKFYIKTPEIFENSYFSNKLELYKLQFDLVEFLTFFSEKYEENWNCLNDFKHIDPVQEVLTLIVQDYVASKVHLVQSISQNEIISKIRDKKIENLNN